MKSVNSEMMSQHLTLAISTTESAIMHLCTFVSTLGPSMNEN